MAKQCQVCGKREAKIHFTEIREGKKTELHLCEECAHEKNMVMAFPSLLSSIMKGEPVAPRQEGDPVPASCPACGLPYAEFKAKGRLGCATCYDVYAPVLVPLLEKVHGKSAHVGRAPERLRRVIQTKKQLQTLEDDLRQAVAEEDYEKAARIRDRIREAKGEGSA